MILLKFWKENEENPLYRLFYRRINYPLANIISSWMGITIIAMFDYNHRMAGKYGVKIENLQLYFSLFDKLTDMEMRGIDSSGIPNEVNDMEDWLRFCRWQAAETLQETQTGNDKSR